MIKVRFTCITKSGPQSNIVIEGEDLDCTIKSFKAAYPKIKYTNTETL